MIRLDSVDMKVVSEKAFTNLLQIQLKLMDVTPEKVTENQFQEALKEIRKQFPEHEEMASIRG